MRTVIVALAVFTLGCSTAAQTAAAPETIESLPVPDAFTAVLVDTLSEEIVPVRGTDGRLHVVYELRLTNARPVPATVEQIEILDYDEPARVLGVLRGEDLAAVTRQLSVQPRADEVLQANESLLVFISLAFAGEEALPARIVHRLGGTGAANPGSTAPTAFSYLAAPRALSSRPVTRLAAPLAGAGWVAANGCCSLRGAHRAAALPVGGALFVSQRFAIDWMRLGEDGRLLSGDPVDPASWNAYGAEVLTVADGTVVEVLDGLPDQVPGALPDPTTLTVETVDGNHVILDLGGGVYAFYAHLRSGSVRVQEGDRVRVGDVLGNLGNSGNTSAPHLHLHLMAQPSALVADGLPHVFERFDVTGSLDAGEWYGTDQLTAAWTIIQEDPPGLHTGELPLDLRIVTFPAPPAP